MKRSVQRSIRPVIAMIALLLVACGSGGGGDGTTPPPTGPTDGNPFDGTGVIGPAGGNVALGDGVSVEIPAGALSEETQIRIVPVSTPADLQAQNAIGQAYRIEPVDAQLSTAARVSIFVPDNVLLGRPLSVVTILRSTGGASNLVPAGEELGNVQQTDGGLVSGRTNRFGTFSAALTATNLPPTVNAGADVSVTVNTTVTVTGTASDPDGDSISFNWTIQSRPSGSSASLSNASSATVSITPDVAGTYVLRVTASDGNGGSASDEVQITATAPPSGGVTADAGADASASVGNTVNLDGTGSTGSNLTYSWRFTSTPAGEPRINNPTSARASFVPNAAGEYVVELTVADGSVSDRDEVRISVTQPNRAPTVNINGPAAVLLGGTATANVSASDPDGDALQFDYDLTTPGGSGASLEVSGTSVSFTPDVAGAYVVTVTVTDGDRTASATVTIFGNPNVAGTYDTTFATTSVSSGCSGLVPEGSTTDTMEVLQSPSSPMQVTLNLTEVTDNIKNNPTGQLRGNEFTYNGTITVGNDDGTANANGTITGTFTAGGEMDLTFSFSVFSCSVSGTIKGTKL